MEHLASRGPLERLEQVELLVPLDQQVLVDRQGQQGHLVRKEPQASLVVLVHRVLMDQQVPPVLLD